MIPIQTVSFHVPPSVERDRPPAQHADAASRERPVAKGDENAVTERRVPPTVEVDRAELEQIRALKNRDREVRQHERAHAAAAAGIAHSAPSYTYERGPDGQMYAVGGEVQIDTSPVAGDPRATLQKAQQIQRAALAPVEPSAADRAVAAQAAAMAATARAEVQLEATERGQAAPSTAPPADDSAGTEGAEGASAAGETTAACAVCGGRHAATGHLADAYGATLGSSPENHPGHGIDRHV